MADPLIIKICGIKTLDMLDATIAAGADMVGFMHFQRSPRHVTIEEIGSLISAARGRIETCVVLVNPDNSCVAEVAALGPDWIQLHGPESPHRVEAIRAEAGVEIMKALPIGSAEDVAHVADFVDIADRILVDAKPPKGADRPGGLGETFDWSLLKALDPSIAFMLSGGLTPQTVAEAIKTVRPFGVDVSSGVESAPGVKDQRMIEAFIRNARAAV
ncbi:MAG: phosphoribosylanthranilate isomerase [Alphaproteobacteria bacterium]|jgi:phosphoribosylanthranilate isomerase|uniref:phosphoribosylanthranilate isomerase n=1 Tax=Devosia sp. XGJD_8 TaxID=3391187 RepID=UPI001D4F8E4E|nr:phosphoribosylanthranilate isomerase [Alphaproteobacteria bacterium]MBU1562290.1 phosphoribosylanthranilate isomerase [Alphaproteobacteria bacterium]MBU2302738.1 phosphoribosylanthranilate isomerase [Alphaproteobacteria bacterium]MBU2369307.1 phosphoribosylanthranilate isomerase [Alphaproteobacteria bacterium]